jgi:hypothetical protein
VLESALQSLEALLKAKYKDVNVEKGLVHSYLGMVLDFSEAGECKITMPAYVENIIAEYNVQGTAVTPADHSLFTIQPTSLGMRRSVSTAA